MKRLILTSVTATAIAVFAFTASVEAGPNHGRGGHGPAPAVRINAGPVRVNVGPVNFGPARVNFGPSHFHTRPLVVHGQSFNVPYRVAGYNGWSQRCYFPNYRCYGYYSDAVWYYWYAPFNQYLPVTYMAMYPPTPIVPPMGVPTAPGVPVNVPPMGVPNAPVEAPEGATLVPGAIPAQ